MTGKHRRTALEFVRYRVRKGDDKQKIFDDLSEEYFERDWLAMLIARVPSPQDSEEMKRMNTLLFSLICAWAAMTLLFKSVIALSLMESTRWIMYLAPLFFLGPAIAVWLALQIKKHDGIYYRIIGLISIFIFLKNIEPLLDETPASSLEWRLSLVYLGLVVAISWLSFLISRRFFPHIAFSGVKKDQAGKYILQRGKGASPI